MPLPLKLDEYVVRNAVESQHQALRDAVGRNFDRALAGQAVSRGQREQQYQEPAKARHRRMFDTALHERPT